jgi:hypothetical protein
VKMSRFLIGNILFLLALSLSLPISAQQANPAKKHKTKPQVVKPEPAPVQPAAIEQPAPPPTPEHGPSSPPEVSFQGGKLTIVARNSTMADVLNAVKQRTGAVVDMPAVSSERVVGRFGPGAPRDVLAQLLNGSHYDYVLVGSPADPGALQKVVLMARASGPEQVPAPQPGNEAPNLRGNQNLQAVPEVDNEPSPEENGGEVLPEAQQQEPQPQEEEPQPDQQGQQNAPVVKTPEQLLRELQQQQQQQQEQPPPGAPGTPPQ